jgi:hypothetical protein
MGLVNILVIPDAVQLRGPRIMHIHQPGFIDVTATGRDAMDAGFHVCGFVARRNGIEGAAVAR